MSLINRSLSFTTWMGSDMFSTTQLEGTHYWGHQLFDKTFHNVKPQKGYNLC